MWFPRTDSANVHRYRETACGLIGTTRLLELLGRLDVGSILPAYLVGEAEMFHRKMRLRTATRRILELIILA